MKQDELYIAFAPLQGYTDATYRRAHWECSGGVGEYYTPFVRIEKGEVRRKDLRDTDPEANHGVPTVPQVIARDGGRGGDRGRDRGPRRDGNGGGERGHGERRSSGDGGRRR